jgi:glucosyl-dolichyl phosphate glucuronosyltransferase
VCGTGYSHCYLYRPGARMTIDLVIPTHNRAELLSRLLDSIRSARVPGGVSVRTIVVDNNSKDATRAVVQNARATWPGVLEYAFEPVQSKSAALNHGLSRVTADIVGMLDDDEEIDREWIAVVARTFADPGVDFISGPYLPRWGAPAPAWLPKDFPGVIGCMDAGNRTLEYGRDYNGVMMGGNAVLRTTAGRTVGWYNVSLGRVGTQVGSGCEDVDFFERLLHAGYKGYYVPELAISHYIPPHRLTKRYHREWCFRRSVAQAELGRLRRQPVAYVFGVPRYMIGTAVRSVIALAGATLRGRWNSSEAFSRELTVWELIGFVAGAIKSGRRKPGTSLAAPLTRGEARP